MSCLRKHDSKHQQYAEVVWVVNCLNPPKQYSKSFSSIQLPVYFMWPELSYLTWYRIITWVTLVLRSTFSCFSSLVRTERTKSPGLLWLSRTRKLPALPLSVSSFSASRPERCPWYHLESSERTDGDAPTHESRNNIQWQTDGLMDSTCKPATWRMVSYDLWQFLKL